MVDCLHCFKSHEHHLQTMKQKRGFSSVLSLTRRHWRTQDLAKEGPNMRGGEGTGYGRRLLISVGDEA